jgi:hypothetical protein
MIRYAEAKEPSLYVSVGEFVLDSTIWYYQEPTHKSKNNPQLILVHDHSGVSMERI